MLNLIHSDESITLPFNSPLITSANIFISLLNKCSLIMAKSEENSQIRQSNRDALFKGILEHPFLWNSKRKMLFLSDF
ncbi:unnamed protein product, partial [Sphagnum balticum]